MEVSDFSGSHWVTLFEEQASKILNKGADELGHLLDTNRVCSHFLFSLELIYFWNSEQQAVFWRYT